MMRSFIRLNLEMKLEADRRRRKRKDVYKKYRAYGVSKEKTDFMNLCRNEKGCRLTTQLFKKLESEEVALTKDHC